MKIEYKIYCKEHAEELRIDSINTDSDEQGFQETISLECYTCSQCQAESYEKGIESVLAKGWLGMKGEI